MLPWMERSRLRLSSLSFALATLLTATFAAPKAVASTTIDSNEFVSESEVARADAYPMTAYEESLISAFRESAEFDALSLMQTKLDPKGLIPKSLLNKAVAYYQTNASLLGNNQYLGVINFAAKSTQRRFFIVNMQTGAVLALHTAHGAGSDRNKDGFADQFGNTNDSNMSSLGFYKTAEVYSGAHGRSLRLDGLSSSNSNARARAIVIHGADYVKDANVVQGRSWGCPAVSMGARDRVVNLLKGGALIYAGLAD